MTGNRELNFFPLTTFLTNSQFAFLLNIDNIQVPSYLFCRKSDFSTARVLSTELPHHKFYFVLKGITVKRPPTPLCVCLYAYSPSLCLLYPSVNSLRKSLCGGIFDPYIWFNAIFHKQPYQISNFSFNKKNWSEMLSSISGDIQFFIHIQLWPRNSNFFDFWTFFGSVWLFLKIDLPNLRWMWRLVTSSPAVAVATHSFLHKKLSYSENSWVFDFLSVFFSIFKKFYQKYILLSEILG